MDERIFYNALAKGVLGDRHILAKLKRRHNDWESAYRCFVSEGSPAPTPENAWNDIASRGIRLIMEKDDDYPKILREIPHPPFGIYVRGRVGPNDGTRIAIVGTRRATPEGKNTAAIFAEKLARAGITIISGLALGIDAAAHEGCLEGNGTTIAILAGGLDAVYPETNRRIATRILAQGGALISEYPVGEPALPRRFLERNRIISGMSHGTLVIEAPDRSGSLATANFALEQNRELFVVPGNIGSPNFKGSHALIRAGAELVTCPEEILTSLGITKEECTEQTIQNLSPAETAILEALRRHSGPLSVDKLSVLARLEPRITNQTLSFLLIRELVKETENGYIIS